jgi:hypothetical protein
MHAMPWAVLAVVAPATAGLLVLGWLGVRVYRDVLRLSREVDSGVRRIASAAAHLERAAEPLARRAGELTRSR